MNTSLQIDDFVGTLETTLPVAHRAAKPPHHLILEALLLVIVDYAHHFDRLLWYGEVKLGRRKDALRVLNSLTVGFLVPIHLHR